MKDAPQNAVLAAVDELHGVLSLAEALLLAGRSLDLNGLETEVAGICEAAIALPPDQGRAARPALAGLLTQVEGLQSRLSGRSAPVRAVPGRAPGPGA